MVHYYAPWASANNVVALFPQASNCWSVHNDLNFENGDKTYFTKEDPQYLFVKELIDAVSAVSSDFDLSKRQGYEPYSAYLKSEFEMPGFDFYCKEFLNQDC